MIYFVRDSLSGLTKIGFSETPWLRLVKIQSDCPGEVSLVGLLAGGRETEAAIHERFAAQRQRGEWFRTEGALAAFLGTLEAPMPDVTAAPSRRSRWIGALADATGATPNTVAFWLKRDRIPGRHWFDISEAGLLSLEHLAAHAHFRDPAGLAGLLAIDPPASETPNRLCGV